MELVQAMDALGDPVRRRIVEELAGGGRAAGELARVVGEDFGISQPATSRHLRVLREAGVVDCTIDGQHRQYSLRAAAVRDVTGWAERIAAFWEQHLDAMQTEIARGKAARRKDHR